MDVNFIIEKYKETILYYNMLRHLKLNSTIKNKIPIRYFTTKKPVPKPKPNPNPKSKPEFDYIIVGLLICLGGGQYINFIEYQNKFNIKK